MAIVIKASLATPDFDSSHHDRLSTKSALSEQHSGGTEGGKHQLTRTSF
ncbi:MAG: hypothetical protein JO047_01950 [Alphaproteobacteria bacterium]|nr:hypothetical protein [Alphaproteobacteria bacterium]